MTIISLADAVTQLQAAPNDGLVPFLGAGISVAPPADCPAWNTLLALAIESAERAHPELRCCVAVLKPHLPRLKPELLCQVLRESTLDCFFGFLDVLYRGSPNANHCSIDQITRDYTVPAILTTNFDVHLEDALGISHTHRGSRLHVGRAPRRVLRALRDRSPPRGRSHLVKIHGSLDDRRSIVLTLRQAGRKLSDDLSEVITSALETHTVLIVGYSGNDDDIFPVLLNCAARARKVFWTLWEDERSITRSIRLFANRCPNCTLVRAGRKDILPRLVRGELSPFRAVGEGSGDIDAREFLAKWAAGIPVERWKNFMFQLVLLIGCDRSFLGVIATESGSLARTASDQLVVGKAMRNCGVASFIGGDLSAAKDALAVAAETYLRLGHHREAIECLSFMVARMPEVAEFQGRDPVFVCADLAGKSYDPYALALFHHAAGMRYLAAGRFVLAREYLLIGGGHARRCGDSVTLRDCLDGLARLFAVGEDSALLEECRKEVGRIEDALGTNIAGKVDQEGRIIRDCEAAAAKSMRRHLVNEALLVLSCTVVVGGVASFFIDGWARRLWTCFALLVTAAGTKIWNARRRLITYSRIDRD